MYSVKFVLLHDLHMCAVMTVTVQNNFSDCECIVGCMLYRRTVSDVGCIYSSNFGCPV